MTTIDSKKDDELVYIPFEHVEQGAKLILVGITPGPNQLRLAYDEARRRVQSGEHWDSVERSVKQVAGFGGSAMRPNLIRLLQHFRVAALLGIAHEADLWGASSGALHSTSVIPHAAFRRGHPFAGTFDEVRRSSVFAQCFSKDFLPTLRVLGSAARYIALGPTALDALTWCVDEQLLGANQLLGAFPHPSTSGGSQVDYFLRKKSRDDLHPSDPVRARLDWLDKAYIEFNAAREAWAEVEISRESSATTVLIDLASYGQESAMNRGVGPTEVQLEGSKRGAVSSTPEPKILQSAQIETPQVLMGSKFSYVVVRGRDAGLVLRPHEHADGCYVVSFTRFKRDYVRVPIGERLSPWLKRGYSLRMSARGRPPVLISPDKITGSD
ncbi:hypothetical protein [Pseudonocardia abyssalis]|uniref:Uncharacterized protein n=1 Tax=Pseudonocardia abyssalis TaxID=2792008 RepID=A0ABS6UZJ0_9PSEU|nr:hypothetical protein [Pseudonocardia abyssalis]MBW0117150.1 hypothetical protein [Pseudonocardia abyssalis]MBW0137680.1 hypothetical protein [Pseudonocardia abyssalis]